MTTQKKQILLILGIILVVGGVWFGLRNSEDAGEKFKIKNLFSGSGKEQNTDAEVIQPVTENTVVETDTGVLKHTDPDFSLSYPKEYVVTSFEDAEGETLLIKNTSTGSEMQVYLVPFDEQIVLTADRIKKDVPTLVMNNVVQIEIGKIVSGVYFKSTKPGPGDSQEVWFVRDGYLYQISAYKTGEKILADLVASFDFK